MAVLDFEWPTSRVHQLRPITNIVKLRTAIDFDSVVTPFNHGLHASTINLVDHVGILKHFLMANAVVQVETTFHAKTMCFFTHGRHIWKRLQINKWSAVFVVEASVNPSSARLPLISSHEIL